MIRMIRLDERMIHGQIAIKWSRHLDVDRIIVVNDEAAANDIIQKSLLLAAPETCKTAIKSVNEALTILKDPRCEPLKILIIVSNPQDLLTIVNEIKDIPLVNVGNYGRIAAKQEDKQRVTYKMNLYAYDNEVELFRQIITSGIECNYQTTPEESAISLKNALGLK